RCSTPAGSSHRVTVVTTLGATDSSINLTETAQHQLQVGDAGDVICTASVSRSRSFSLVRRDGETPPAESASAAPSAPAPTAPTPSAQAPNAQSARPNKDCTKPGDPARLEVVPARKLMRPGERFAFRAVVLDAEGCAVAVKPTWTMNAGSLASSAS